MDRGLLEAWRRAARDPYTLLLTAAAAAQVILSTTSGFVVRPGWAYAAITLFVVTVVITVVGRLRHDAAVQLAAPFVLLVVTACWRAADSNAVNGFGALAVVAVVWVGCYGTRTQVLFAIAGAGAAMIVPPLAVGAGLSADDWRHAALTTAVVAFIGPTINSLVQRGTQTVARLSALEPTGGRLDAMLHAATGHLIVACDPDGTIVEFNQGAEQLLGWRADEVVGKSTMLFHDPVEITRRAAELGVEPGIDVLTANARRGQLDIHDWTLITKDDRRVVVSLTVSGIRDGSGELTGFMSIGTDVTPNRTAADFLDAQREIYRLLVDHLPLTTVALFDADLRCLTIGGHWLAKSGKQPRQLRGIRVDEFFTDADRARGLELYTQALTRPVEAEMDLSDGHSYEFSALPVTGPNGEHLVLSLARDVTGRRQAELERQQMLTALAVSESNFREAFEGAPIGMALTTVQDAPAERFLRVNPAFAAILGRTPEDLVGIPVADVTHPEDVSLQPDLSRRQSHNPTLRKRFMRPSGRAVWVEVSYSVVRDEDGTPSHVVKQIQDINTIKESERALLDALEQQRAATASLRELDRIRNDLVGTISHELRTPLTSIHGYLELLGDEQLTPSQLSMIEVALRNAERLGSLVDDLLVLVRLDSIDSVGSVSEAIDVSVPAAVSNAIDTVRPEITERHQELNVTTPVEPAIVFGDAEQLDRVLVNLLSNASKYTPIGGRIDVAVTTQGGGVSIEISDTGIGIPLDEQGHLFTRFFRASTARANSISGNGLGLAIVKSIVERHGGQVSVESTPGAGSRFTITLPLMVQAPVVLNA